MSTKALRHQAARAGVLATRVGDKHAGVVDYPGGILYVSYGTIIGYRRADGGPGVFTQRKYSVTTSAHQRMFMQAGDITLAHGNFLAHVKADTGYDASFNAAPVSF